MIREFNIRVNLTCIIMIKQKVEDLEEKYLVSKMPFVVKIFNDRFRYSINLGSLNAKSRVLDAGCNRGYFLGMINDLGTSDLYGIDINKKNFKRQKTQTFYMFESFAFF